MKKQNNKRTDFFLIGLRHDSSQDDEFQRQLVFSASAGKNVVGLEGFVYTDKQKVEEFIVYAYGIKNAGLIYGIEDDFVKQYCSALLHYGYIAVGMTDQIYIAKLQLIVDIHISQTMREVWNVVCSNVKNYSPDVISLVLSINSFISENNYLGIKGLVNKFSSELKQPPFSDDNAYKELFKIIIRVIEQTADPKYGLASFKSEVDEYIKDPANCKHQAFVVYQINGEWRDNFIVNNMKEIIKHAAKLSLPVYFLIGSGHIQSLSAKMDSEYEGYIKRVYYNTQIIPKEFLP